MSDTDRYREGDPQPRRRRAVPPPGTFTPGPRHPDDYDDEYDRNRRAYDGDRPGWYDDDQAGDDEGYEIPAPRRSARPGARSAGGYPPPVRPAGARGLVVAGRTLLALASVVVFVATGFTWYTYKDLTSGLQTSNAVAALKPTDQGYVAPHLDSSVNLLLIGLDSRKDMNGNNLPTQFVEQELHAGSSYIGGYNTNVLILLHIPANGGAVTAFSIPRDDYVEEPGGPTDSLNLGKSIGRVPDLGKHKIKEAYGRAKDWAERQLTAQGVTDKAELERKSRDVGRLSTISTVQLLTGVHVDHFAEVNLLGFYDIVNDLGTIEVCLNHDVNDPIEGGGGTGLKLSAGHHLLDAATALQFVRQRHNLTNGDLDRTHRQQAFLSSVIHKLKTEGVIGDLGKMQSLLDTVKKDMVIDDQWDVLDFATKAQNLTGGNTEFHTLPLADVPNPFPILPGDGSVNLVDPARIKAIVTGAFNNDAPIPAATTATATAAPSPTTSLAQGTAEVYNATPAQVHGLAGAAQAKLSAAGWPVAKTGNLPGRSKTTIAYGTGAQAAASQMAAKLGLTLTPVPSAQVKPGYVVITIGADYAAVGLTATTTNQGPSVGATTATAPLVAIPTEGAQGGAVNASDGVPCVN